MNPYVLKLIDLLYKDGSITGLSVILIVILAVLATWKISRIYMQHEAKHKTLDSFDFQKCTKHEEKVASCETRLSTQEDTSRKLDVLLVNIENLTDSMLKVETWIMKNDQDMISSFAKKCSPYQLTAAGKNLLEISKGKECIDKNLDTFTNQLKEYAPLTEYDVEENAKAVLLEASRTPLFNQIKDYLYNSPSKFTFEGEGESVSAEINISTVLFVMSIYLRDKYLEKYPFSK